MPTWFSRIFKKTGISNALDGTEDDVLWTANSNSRENDDATSKDNWHTDEKMCRADYTALFGNDESSDESDFEGFRKMNNEWLYSGFYPT